MNASGDTLFCNPRQIDSAGWEDAQAYSVSVAFNGCAADPVAFVFDLVLPQDLEVIDANGDPMTAIKSSRRRLGNLRRRSGRNELELDGTGEHECD